MTPVSIEIHHQGPEEPQPIGADSIRFGGTGASLSAAIAAAAVKAQKTVEFTPEQTAAIARAVETSSTDESEGRQNAVIVVNQS